MNLIVNGPAIALSSLGVRRYFSRVMQFLQWPGATEILASSRYPVFERPRELLRRGRNDAIFWTPCQRGPLRARHHVVTVHDCINVEYVYRHDWRLPVYRRLFTRILRGAEAIVAISNATKAAILRNYDIDEATITVIQSGADVLPVDPTAESRWSGPELARQERPYILMVTNAMPYKNATAAITGFAKSHAPSAGISLRVVGSLSGEAQEASRSSGHCVETLKGLSDAELSRLYSGCLFLLSPSLAEGHNLPIAEALEHGANVLCSDIEVHREFYDGRACFFDPNSSDDIASTIDLALGRRGPWFPNGLIRSPRTFADVAREYRALFHSIASRR